MGSKGSPLPSNVHISTHPCLQVKISQLRSPSMSDSRHVQAAVDQITSILATEATAHCLQSSPGAEVASITSHPYTTTILHPTQTISLIPILRSGLSMVPSLQSLLPNPVPIHHLGLFRQPSTLEPVEYYNKLPHTISPPSDPHQPHPSNPTAETNVAASHTAILLDPIIATGGTCAAAIQTLREWGAQRIIVIAILGAREGVERAAREWAEGTEVWVGAVDEGVDGSGMIVPGLGDMGDRLFVTGGGH